MENTKKISLLTRFAYGTGNLLGSGALSISGAWLLYFYTTFCDISVVQATLIFSIPTYLDVIMNPLMGFISDNFYATKLGRKFGRRRFFILIGIPLMLVYPLMWVQHMNFLYYLTTYLLFEVIYTSVMIPYETLAVEMTNDFDERSILTGSKAMFGTIASFLAAFIPGVFISIFGQDSPKPFFYTAIVYSAILVISLTLLYFNSWEKNYTEIAVEKVPSVIESLKKLFIDIFSTLRIRTFRNHLGMYLFGFGAQWLFTANFTYYLVFALQRPSTFVSAMNSMSSILQLVSTAIFIVICIKKGFSKPFTWALTVVIAATLGYSALYIFGLYQLTWIIVAMTVFFGLGTGGVYYIPWTVYTFLADVDEVVTNRRREGVYAGAMVMAGKMIRASVVFLLGVVLSEFGFVSGANSQPISAQNAIVGVLIFGVCGLSLLGIFFSNKMKLDHKSHKIILDELDRIHQGGTMSSVDSKTKEVIEELTGIPYESCFGNNTIGYREA